MKLSLKDIENMGLWSKLKLDHQEKEVFLDRINKTLQSLKLLKNWLQIIWSCLWINQYIASIKR